MLPPNLLHSPYYTVDNRVGLDNYQYVFTVNTRWGTFPIKGDDLMRVRAREIEATAKMAEIDTAETVVDAAGRTALKPLATAKELITAPGKTIADTFKGVGNIFGSVGASMSGDRPAQRRHHRLRSGRRRGAAQDRLRSSASIPIRASRRCTTS